jgi:hypothetical protein
MSNDVRKAYGKIVARAWADPAFAQRVDRDPAGVLEEHGIDAATGEELRIAVASRPPEALDVESLGPVVGSSTVGSAGSLGCAGTICGTVGTLGSSGTAGSR